MMIKRFTMQFSIKNEAALSESKIQQAQKTRSLSTEAII